MSAEFAPAVALENESSAPPLWFVVRGTDVLVKLDATDGRPFPIEIEIDDLVQTLDHHVLGTFRNRPVLTAELPAEVEPPENMQFLGLRRLFGTLDPLTYGLASRAVQIVEWDRTHRYCGRCGSETQLVVGQRARQCPDCDLIRFPRLDPSVIVSVERAGKILLARNATYAAGSFSVLAGFVDQGETLEEAVKREVLEEAGVEVGEIRYFGSQPWPFPHGLMMAFIAEWKSGELEPDPGEIDEVGWFAPDELPDLPGKISIARDLIDDFVRRSRGE